MALRPALRRVLGLGLLLAAAATPLLAGWTAPLALAALAGAWLSLRPPRREVVLAGVPILAAAVALALAAGLAPPADPADADWRAATLDRYDRLWRELEREAERAAAVLPDRLATADRVELFRALAGIAPTDEAGRGALLLVDPDGTPAAWAGEGLLHELTAEAIPRAGPDYRASFAAVTALVVRPLGGEGRRPWRVIAARSFATDRLPFAPGAGSGPPLRWSLVGVPSEAAPGTVVLEVEGAPDLVVESAPAVAESAPDHARRLRRFAGLALALALFALAVVRGLGIALAGEEGGAAGGPGAVRRRRLPALDVAVLAVAAAVVAAAAAGASFPVVAALPLAALLAIAGGLATAAVPRRAPGRSATSPDRPPAAEVVDQPAPAPGGARRGESGDHLPPPPAAPRSRGGWPPDPTPRLPRSPLAALVAGAASILLLAGLALLLRRLAGPVDGGPVLFGAATGFVSRAALAAAAAGLLALSGWLGRRGPRAAAGGDGWAWGAIAALLAGAAVCDFPAAALPLFAAGGAAAARWVAGRTLRRPVEVALLALVAVLAASGVGETVARALLRGELAVRVAARAAPPGPGEMAALREEVAAAFSGLRLADFVPRSPEGLERQDLAFLLWQSSPLAHPHALSALVVRP
ncbi:MAG TPA: hypothetical protein VF100_09500, partial [Thermoanaerobaculia bacterium]